MNTALKYVAAGTLAAALGWATTGHAAAAEAGVIRWTGTGVQIYACKHDADRIAWVLQRPEATLTDAHGETEGRHGAGPSWTSVDGSVVYGSVLTAVPAPAAGAIPWLVLRASKHEGAGQMSGVAFVLRTDTDGGAAPATGCDTAHEGAELRVPYKALYTFLVEPG